MKQNWWKLAIVVVLIAAVGVAIAVKNSNSKPGQKPAEIAAVPEEPAVNTSQPAVEPETQELPVSDTASANTEAAKANNPVQEKTAEAAIKEQAKTVRESTKQKADATVKETAKQKIAVQKKNTAVETKAQKTEAKKKQLPMLAEFGSTKCIPCKMMAPILEELEKEYKGKLDVVFIDVWENRGEAEKYNIKSIPTQIFYDQNGEEFFRHEGFFSKEDILKTFAEKGIKL